MTVEAGAGVVITHSGPAARAPDLIIRGTPLLVVGIVTGKLSLSDAVERGLELDGDPAVLERVLIQAVTAP